MDSLFLPLRTLVDPVGAIPNAVSSRRWVWPLLLLCVSTAAAGAVVALRLDTARVVIPKLAMSGELMRVSEREVDEAVQQAERIALVGGIAKGVLLMPLLVLVLAVVLKIAMWLMGRKTLFAELFTVAALTMLPVVVFHLIEIVAAVRLDLITPRVAESLVPSSLTFLSGEGVIGRVYKALDFVNVWSALMMGVGLAAASKWTPARGAVFGLVLYVLFAAAIFVGLPGLMPPEGMGGGR